MYMFCLSCIYAYHIHAQGSERSEEDDRFQKLE